MVSAVVGQQQSLADFNDQQVSNGGTLRVLTGDEYRVQHREMVGRIAADILNGVVDQLPLVTPARMIKAMLSISSPDVRSVRAKTGMTQPAFAKAFGFPLSTLRQWEQGRREPTGAARTLLTIIDRAPEAVLGALGDGS